MDAHWLVQSLLTCKTLLPYLPISPKIQIERTTFNLQNLIPRAYNTNIIRQLKSFPIVALIGPRQSGKTTLAKEVLAQQKTPSLYLDLELQSDLVKLDDAEQFLLRHANS